MNNDDLSPIVLIQMLRTSMGLDTWSWKIRVSACLGVAGVTGVHTKAKVFVAYSDSSGLLSGPAVV